MYDLGNANWNIPVERAKSIDDMLMIASALKKLLTHVHFRKIVCVEEQQLFKIEDISKTSQASEPGAK